MSSEQLHAPRERLTVKTLTMHQAITSVMEELEAVDWYRQRADDCEDGALKAILLHNMREEIEHACMTLEWLRRNDGDFAKMMETYLFSEGSILEAEEAATGKAEDCGARGAEDPAPDAAVDRRRTVGPLKGR